MFSSRCEAPKKIFNRLVSCPSLFITKDSSKISGCPDATAHLCCNLDHLANTNGGASYLYKHLQPWHDLISIKFICHATDDFIKSAGQNNQHIQLHEIFHADAPECGSGEPTLVSNLNTEINLLVGCCCCSAAE
jgi:hypothetical protein